MSIRYALSVLAAALLLAPFALAQAPSGEITLDVLDRFDHGGFDEGAAEIVSYDATQQRLYVINSEAVTLDVLDVSDPTNLTLEAQLDMTQYGDSANSVDVFEGHVAVAIEADSVDANGKVLILDGDASVLAEYEVGVLPDMLTFTPNGRHIVTANEGQPSDDYSVDPDGSVSIIDLPENGVSGATVRHVTFDAFNGQENALRADGVRIFGPGASASQDFEPEYVAVTPDSTTGFVVLQENNAVAKIDLVAGSVDAIVPLGYKNWSQGAQIDVNDKDDAINLGNWPIFGMYQPDAIAGFAAHGRAYLVTANEGDARDYDTYSEEARVEDLTLDPTVFPNAAELQSESMLGRLETTTAIGDVDGDGDHDRIYAYGARSITIWGEDGSLVWDSGDQIERAIEAVHPELFGADNDESVAESYDSRSDAKGAEPEGVVIGEIGGATYAFVGLERIGGVMTWNVSNPETASLAGYYNDRPIDVPADSDEGGDLGPEGLAFIHADHSPTGEPLLVVANEVSGTTVVYHVQVN
jgi:hypothetical protein